MVAIPLRGHFLAPSGDAFGPLAEQCASPIQQENCEFYCISSRGGNSGATVGRVLDRSIVERHIGGGLISIRKIDFDYSIFCAGALQNLTGGRST
jgi:hypothetical protein